MSNQNTDIHYKGFAIGRNPFKPFSYRIFKGVWLVAVADTLQVAYRIIDQKLESV
jgi:hypothetical protein